LENILTQKNLCRMIVKRFFQKMLFILRNNELFPENSQLLTLFNKHTTCYILGSAPTISKLNLKQLDKDAMIVTTGNFYEHPQIRKIGPNIHVFAASHPPMSKKVLTNWWMRCNDILPEKTILLIEKRDREVAKKVFSDRKLFFYSYGGQLPVDFTKKILSPQSVTIIALQLAIYVGLKEIFLLGINHDWQCITPYLHFYDHNKPSLEFYLKEENIEISYELQKQPYPKERLYREYELYQQYESLYTEAKKNNIAVFNGDKFSDFDVFPHKIIND